MSSSGWRTSRRGKASTASSSSLKKPSKNVNNSNEGNTSSSMHDTSTAAVVKGVLDKCQKSKQSFHPSAMTIKKYLEKDPEKLEELTEAFISYVELCLPVYKKSDPVDRVITFIGELCKELGAPMGDRFGTEMVSSVLEYWNAKDKGVRSRVCQITCAVLGNLSEDVEISDTLWSKLVDHMKKRTFDKICSIRVQAVRAVERLQDITDPDCPIVKRLCQVMENDQNKDVRAAAVHTVALTEGTLRFVLRRVKDVDSCVRIAAVQNINERVACSSLSLEQRVSLLRTCFSDRDKGVLQATRHLIISWLARCDFDCCKLLRLFDVVSNFEVCKQVLEELMKVTRMEATREYVGGTTSKTDESQLNKTTESQLNVQKRFDGVIQSINYPVWENTEAEMEESELVEYSKSLSPEHAALWMCTVANISMENPTSSKLDKIVPTLSQICFIIFSLCDEPERQEGEEYDEDETADIAAQRQFIMECLLNISEQCDFHDEMGRQRFILLVKELMGHKGPNSDDESSSMLSLMLLGSEDTGPDGIGAPWLWTKSTDNRRMAHLGQIGLGVAVEGAPLLYGFMKALLRVIGRKEEFVRLVVEVLEDLLDSDEGQENNGEEEEDLGAIRRKTASLSSYYTRWVRALHITGAVLKLSECNLQSPELADLIPTVILPGVTSEFCAVRTLAIYSLGLAVMVGGTTPSDSARPGNTATELARQHLPLAITALEKDEDCVKMVALQVLTDWMLLFNPFELAKADDNGCLPAELLLTYLEPHGKTRVLTIDEPRLYAVTTESISKLVFTGRLNDNVELKRKALSYLLRSYFTPSPEFSDEAENTQPASITTDDEELNEDEISQIVKTKQAAEMRMRQSLGSFFVTFSKMSSSNQTDIVVASSAAIRLLATDVALSTIYPSAVDTQERLTSLEYALQFISFLNQRTTEQTFPDQQLVEYFSLPCIMTYHQFLGLVIGETITEEIPNEVAYVLADSMSKLSFTPYGSQNDESVNTFCREMKRVQAKISGKAAAALGKSLKSTLTDRAEDAVDEENSVARSVVTQIDQVVFGNNREVMHAAGNGQAQTTQAVVSEESDDDEDGTSFSPAKRVVKKTGGKSNRVSMGMAFVQSQVQSFEEKEQKREGEDESSSDDGSFVSANENDEETQPRNKGRNQSRGSTESHVGPSGRNSMSLDPDDIQNALAGL